MSLLLFWKYCILFYKTVINFHLLSDGVVSNILSLFTCGTLIWFVAIQTLRLSLKILLSYKGWMYESPHAKSISAASKLWLVRILKSFLLVRQITDVVIINFVSKGNFKFFLAEQFDYHLCVH